jgi:hypothetical protein
MTELDTVYSKNDSVVSRKIVDELILVPIRKSVADMESLFTLNDVGARIYELIDGGRTVREICNVIVEEFEVDFEQARADVLTFLDQLKSFGSIEEKSPSHE